MTDTPIGKLPDINLGGKENTLAMLDVSKWFISQNQYPVMIIAGFCIAAALISIIVWLFDRAKPAGESDDDDDDSYYM